VFSNSALLSISPSSASLDVDSSGFVGGINSDKYFSKPNESFVSLIPFKQSQFLRASISSFEL